MTCIEIQLNTSYGHLPKKHYKMPNERQMKGVKISKERFKSAFENAKKEHPDAFEQFPDELNENMVSLLTLEEESTYLDFYIQNITTTCNFLKCQLKFD